MRDSSDQFMRKHELPAGRKSNLYVGFFWHGSSDQVYQINDLLFTSLRR